MVNITVYQNGDVIGDKGKVIAYVGQNYSEPIQIVHPIFEGNPIRYFVEYKYNHTRYKDELDSNNRVQLKIEKNGYIQCQFIAENIYTGAILFKSKSWNFIVKEEFNIEPSHYPCSGHTLNYSGHDCFNNSYNKHHHNDNMNFDYYKAYYELKTEIENEETIRYNEILQIQQDLIKIKEALNIVDNTLPIHIDANKVITAGNYNADVTSINFPDVNQEYKLSVTTYTDHILQQAFEIDSDNVWYRTGTSTTNDSSNIIWTSWSPLIMRVETI